MTKWMGVMLVSAGIVLAGCTKQQSQTQSANVSPEVTTAEQKANQFLIDNGITLPPGVDRVTLQEVNNSGATGVVTREVRNQTTTWSVLADLPNPGTGHYVATITNATNAAITLGTLRSEKGGYMVDYSTNKDVTGYTKVMISKVQNGQSPQTMLQGAFGQ